ncbi:Oligosaccharide translocation protein rft1 [Podila epigama]|nr:Oligosaccharide translocation protein rft1 [Podila epigama]
MHESMQSSTKPTSPAPTRDTSHPSADDNASAILSSSAKGASYLVLLQFISRMLTFSLNQILLRFTSAETLGIASVQLELLLNTILFLSREGVRCAAIRVGDDAAAEDDDDNNNNNNNNLKGSNDKTKPTTTEAYRLQKLVNMVYAPIPVGALMTCLAVGYYLQQIDHGSEARFPGYRLSIYLYGLSALIELMAEPMFMVAQYKLWFKTRVSVEGTAVIVRCILTCALTIYGARFGAGSNTMGVLAFAIAQLSYAVLTLGGFLVAFWRKSAEKHALDHHKRVASAKKDDDKSMDQDQNEYISMRALLPGKLCRTNKHEHTGSLVARILFQPMEEISRTLFSKLLSDIVPESETTVTKTDGDHDTKSSPGQHRLSPTQLSNLAVSQNLLLTMMKFHILLGGVFIAFGTHYTATLIDLVVGRRWSRETVAPAVLSLYCYYVPIMGLNGITEAVVQAVASEQELKVLSYWMVAFSAIFCSAGAFLMGHLGLGAQGIVLANCVNLSMRILWSTWFLSRYYGRYLAPSHANQSQASINASVNVGFVRMPFSSVPWKTIVPSPMVLLTFGAGFMITAASEQVIGWDRLHDKALHLSVGVFMFLATMLSIYVFEKPFIRDIQRVVSQRRR